MAGRSRPLSPFLNYRWQYTNTLSILHRLTGLTLTVGFVLLVYWITAVSLGPSAYARAAAVLSRPLLELLLALGAFAFAYHFCNGIRHLLWDTSSIPERREARASAWIVVLGAIVLAAVIGSIAWLRQGGQ